MKYKNNTKSDLTFADGKTIEAYNVADVEPKTDVEKAWVSSGMIEAIEQPEPEPEPEPEPAPVAKPEPAPAKAPAKAEAKTTSDKK